MMARAAPEVRATAAIDSPIANNAAMDSTSASTSAARVLRRDNPVHRPRSRR